MAKNERGLGATSSKKVAPWREGCSRLPRMSVMVKRVLIGVACVVVLLFVWLLVQTA
jgi:hypothetical protein